MKIDDIGLKISKHRSGEVDYFIILQNGTLTLHSYFYDWGVKNIVPRVYEVDQNTRLPIMKAQEIVSMLSFPNANRLSDQEKIKLIVDRSKRFKGRIDLSLDYKFKFESELLQEELEQINKIDADDSLEALED